MASTHEGAQRRERLAGSRLLLLLTRSLCRRDPLETLSAALRGGVDAVQIREKEGSSREILEWARRVRERVPGILFVNDRADLALLADADGVHLGQDDLPARAARSVLGADRLVAVSTHDAEQALAAQRDGADAIGFGPIFSTRTKGAAKGLGPGALLSVIGAVEIPVFPIGGIDPRNAADLALAGRAAVSSALLRAEDPERAARAIRSALGG